MLEGQLVSIGTQVQVGESTVKIRFEKARPGGACACNPSTSPWVRDLSFPATGVSIFSWREKQKLKSQSSLSKVSIWHSPGSGWWILEDEMSSYYKTKAFQQTFSSLSLSNSFPYIGLNPCSLLDAWDLHPSVCACVCVPTWDFTCKKAFQHYVMQEDVSLVILSVH